MCRLGTEPRDGVMNAPSVARQRTERHVDSTALVVIHIECALGYALAYASSCHGRSVVVDDLHPVVVADAELGSVGLAHPDDGTTASEGEHQ